MSRPARGWQAGQQFKPPPRRGPPQNPVDTTRLHPRPPPLRWPPGTWRTRTQPPWTSWTRRPRSHAYRRDPLRTPDQEGRLWAWCRSAPHRTNSSGAVWSHREAVRDELEGHALTPADFGWSAWDGRERCPHCRVPRADTVPGQY
ncbi:hypothetical protein CJD44_21245 [Streptomyces sp. alain-838]|nr:hypothetical protein CJD44_21245 [Streptomyces sp. alain-838]